MWKQQKAASTYVVVKVTSDSTERFLNMCRHKSIVFWDIKRNDEGFNGKITRKDFLKLKEVCYKTKTRVRITKKKGFRFLLFKYRKHYSFVVGMLLAGILIYSCSLFVWDISFTGNSEYTDSNLMKYLNGYHIHPGIKISEINCDAIETSIRNGYDGITWVSAEISGTRLIIHIKENDGAKEISSNMLQERDIIATESGTIKSIITRKGTPLVKPGDQVEAGQILVSGIVNIYNDSAEVAEKKYVSADSDIIIRTTKQYSDNLKINYEYKDYSGDTITKNLFVFNDTEVEYGMNFKHFKEADELTETKVLKLTNNFYLPIHYGSITYYEYELKTADYSEEEAKKILYSRFVNYQNELIENNVQILDKNVNIYCNGISYIMEGELALNMPAYTYASITDTTADHKEKESN